MSAANILSPQREEITRCAERREKLLRTLFGVTQSYLHLTSGPSDETSDAEKQDRELSAFLDANDISQNRFFDLSTLPSSQHIRLSHYNKRRRKDSVEQKFPQVHGAHLYTNHDRHTILQTTDQVTEDRRLVELTTGTLLAQAVDHDGGSIQKRPPLNDVGGSINNNAGLNAEKDHGIDSGGRIAYEVSNEDTGNHRRSPNDTAQAKHVGDGHASNLTPPDSGRSLYGPKDEQGRSNIPKAQSDSLTQGNYETVPATPTEQTRMEETHLTREPPAPLSSGDQASAHSNSNSVDLPSRLIEGAYDEHNTIIDMSPLGEDLSKHQQAPVEHDSLTHGTASSMRDSFMTGLKSEASSDPTTSRRPPMRIDTGVAPQLKDSPFPGEKTVVASPEAATPSKSAPLSTSAQSPPERMTTRGISGALRHKSVSEILGETPRTASPSERNMPDSSRSDLLKSASTAASPGASAFKLRLSELKDKEKNKLSTVIFARQQPQVGARSLGNTRAQDSGGVKRTTENFDYFLNFFAAQVYQSPRAPSLNALLRQANKTLATSDHYIELREKQDFKVLTQLKEMQYSGRWSLRQPERTVEPQRSATHWDVLLGQVKWMRTDFREERKFKLAGAKHLAEACAAWVSAPVEDRCGMQIQLRNRPLRASATPDLMRDESSEIMEDELPAIDPTISEPPAAIFSLPPDVFVFGLNQSPVAEKILLELPCYEPAQDVQDSALSNSASNPDASWKTRLVPVSKYAYGKLISSNEGPPQKKACLDDLDAVLPTLAQEQDHNDILPPVNDDIALFNPQNKHIRDRIHAGHAFRPPSEYQMPSRDFFENRQPSAWTVAEDDELRKLVREYSYNWSLISSCLATSTLYTPESERRNPWECFERWISLEGLPAEMSKVPYFRTYHQRLQSSSRTWEAHHQALLQQQGGNPAQLPLRRRSNQPYSTDRRKSNKPLHLVDAMRKRAKKKEAALHKQQQQATLGAMRKNNEPPKERKNVIPTPREFSRMKYEKEKIAEHNRMVRMNHAASMQNVKKAAQQGSNSQLNGNMPNRSSVTGMLGGNNANPSAAVSQYRGGGIDPTRSGQQAQRLVNGQANGIGPGQNVPNAPMHSPRQVSAAQRGPNQMPNDVRLYQEAQRVQAEQAYLQQQRQQQRHVQQNGHSGSPNMQSLNHPSQGNPALLASIQGRLSPSINGSQNPSGSSVSPRIGQSQPQSLSSGVTPAVNQIQNQVKRLHPGASPGEISRLTTEQLVRMSQQQLSQQAMAAAAGNSGAGLAAMPAPNAILQHQQAMLNNPNSPFNQQQYAAYMRTQQAAQSRTGSAGNGAAMGLNGSGSVTPLVRTGSAQGGAPRGPSQSPRPAPIGVAGAQ